MWRFLRPASRLAALAAALLSPGLALAQAADPFGAPLQALPASAAAQPIFVEITVNGERLDGLAEIRFDGDRLMLRLEDARRAGLKDAVDLDGFIPLARQAGVRFDYDPAEARLTIVRRRTADGPNRIDLYPHGDLEGSFTPLTAAIVEQDSVVQADRFGVRAGGYVSARVVRGGLSAGSSFAFDTAATGGRKPIVRLDTAVVWRDSTRLRSATLGDFVSRSPFSDRAVRMAGLRVGTDFATRPDLITYPLPAIAGTVAVPTSVDILVNDRRIAEREVEAGDFAIRNLPVQFGRNRVGLIVRDTLGRERVDDRPLYASPLRYAPGLSSTQGQLGVVRRDYALRSSDYGALALDVSHRRGVSPRLTVEAALSGGGGLIAGGGGATMALGSFGQASVDFRLSRGGDADAGRRHGRMVTVGFESIGQPISVTLDARVVSRGFRDIAAAAGDPPPTNRLAAGFAFDLAELGRLRIDAVREIRELDRPDDRIRTTFVGASYVIRIGRRANLFADLRRDMGRGTTAAFLGLSLTLGQDGRTLAQASVTRADGHGAVQAGLLRPDAEIGDWGWRVEAGAGDVTRVAASISRRLSWMRAELQGEHIAGQGAVRANVASALVLADGWPYLTHRVGGSLALVRTGQVDGVGVERENRPAGVSSRGGRTLVFDIPAWTPTTLAVAADSLPAETVLTRARAVVRVPEGAAALVDLTVLRVRPLYVRVIGPDGLPLAAGTRLRSAHGVRIVGFDGQAEIDGEADRAGLVASGLCRVAPDTAYAAVIGAPAYARGFTLACRAETDWSVIANAPSPSG